MLALADLRRSADQQFNPAPAQITFKDSVRIVEIADDQIKIGKKGGQPAGQFGVLPEKGGGRSVSVRRQNLCVDPILLDTSKRLAPCDANFCAGVGATR